MEKNKINLKIILQIVFFIFVFNTSQAKNPEKYYTGYNISKYFSGIISYSDNDYSSSYKHLKALKGLEDIHSSYPELYLYSLVNLDRIKEAYLFARKLENRKLESFESNLVIGVYYLKNKKYYLADKYFKKLIKQKNERQTLRGLLSISINNWVSFLKIDKKQALELTNNLPKNLTNLKRIQDVFIHCFYESPETIIKFETLVSDQKNDFSRYYFFYINYLNNFEGENKAIEKINYALKSYPRNLMLNQLKEDLISKNVENMSNQFNCKDVSHVLAEIFYINSNIFTSQSIYSLSNFYLSLGKYLNPNFISYDAFQAENFYMIDKLTEAKKRYNKVLRSGSFYKWHASRRIASILLEEDKGEEALKTISNAYKKIVNPNINEIFDYAVFLKNNEKFEESIEEYNKVLKLIDKQHYLYPKASEGRGVSYERIGQWKKAEKDLLNSLEVLPDQAYVINYLAYSWVEKGINIDKSLQMLEKANNLKENDGYIIDSLGWALFKLKKYDESKKYLEMAIKIMPSDPVVNDHYGDSLWMNNEEIQARYYWNYAFNSEKAEKKLKETIKRKLIFGLE